MNSIKTRVTVAMLGVFLWVLWTAAFTASHYLRQDMEHELGDQQLATVRLVANQANALLSERIKALELIAGAIDTKTLASSARLQTFLDNRFVLHNLFNRGVMAHRLDGTVVADTLPERPRIGVNYRDRDYFVGATKEGKATVGRPSLGKALGVPIFGISVPVRDADGRVIGALTGATDLGIPNFLDQITLARYGRTGGYLIVEPKSRRIVAATDKSLVMEYSPPHGQDPVVDRFLAGTEGSDVLVNPKGVPVLQSAATIPASGWYIAATLPTEEAFAPIRQLEQRLLVITLLLTLAAGAITWWLIRWQLSSLVRALYS